MMFLGAQKAALVNTGNTDPLIRCMYSWGETVEAIPDCPASVHRPCCGEAEQLQGYTPAELLRLSNRAACKMLATPHYCFLNLLYKICKAPKLSNVGAQHWMFFNLYYITSRGESV